MKPAVIALSLGALCTTYAVAGTIELGPTTLSIGDEPSVTVTVRNIDNDFTPMKVAVFDWVQTSSDPQVLKPTTRVAYYPTLFDLDANAAREVRFGPGDRTPSSVEQAYRVIIRELPSAALPPGGRLNIRVLKAWNIPLFVEPTEAHTSARPQLDRATVTGGTLHVTVSNAGDVHIPRSKMMVTVVDRDGHGILQRELPLFYVLARSSIEADLELGSACDRGSAIHLAWAPEQLPQASATVPLVRVDCHSLRSS